MELRQVQENYFGGPSFQESYFLPLANRKGIRSSTFLVPCAFYLSKTRPEPHQEKPSVLVNDETASAAEAAAP